MENSKEIVRKCLVRIEFERYAAEAEIEDLCPSRGSFAQYGVGIRASHGDALGFPLNGENRAGLDAGCCARR